METIFIVLTMLVALDLVALWGGCDSRDSVDSPEWERLRNWQGFH